MLFPIIRFYSEYHKLPLTIVAVMFLTATFTAPNLAQDPQLPAYICVQPSSGSASDRLIQLSFDTSTGFVISGEASITVFNQSTPLFIQSIPRLLEDGKFGTYRLRQNGLIDKLRTHPFELTGSSQDPIVPCEEQLANVINQDTGVSFKQILRNDWYVSEPITARSDKGFIISAEELASVKEAPNTNSTPVVTTPQEATATPTPTMEPAIAILASYGFQFPGSSMMVDFEILQTSQEPVTLAFPDLIDPIWMLTFSNGQLSGSINYDNGSSRQLSAADQQILMEDYRRLCSQITCSGSFFDAVILENDFKTVPVTGEIRILELGVSITLQPVDTVNPRFSKDDVIAVNEVIDGCGPFKLFDNSDGVSCEDCGEDGEPLGIVTNENARHKILEVNIEAVLPFVIDNPGGDPFYTSAICLVRSES